MRQSESLPKPRSLVALPALVGRALLGACVLMCVPACIAQPQPPMQQPNPPKVQPHAQPIIIKPDPGMVVESGPWGGVLEAGVGFPIEASLAARLALRAPLALPAALEPASALAGAGLVVEQTPISSGLGLMDLRLSALPGSVAKLSGAVVLPRWTTEEGEPRPGALVRNIPLMPMDGAWAGRLQLGARPPALALRVEFEDAAPRVFDLGVPTIRPKNPTPDWAKGAVWYQIFPERFRNANPANDPRGPAVFLAPWNSDWYSVQPGELEAWQARDAARQRADWRPHRAGPLYNVIWDRRYGGDLQGVLDKLDELADLGVTAIYLNPIFQAHSLHKYDAADFRHIDAWLGTPPGAPVPPADGTYTPPAGETDDPATWTWTAADRWFIDEFLPAAKRRGIRVILDGVWNHTGREFWAFQDVQRHGRKSKYADWFIVQFDDQGRLASWSGWDGPNGWLPEFRQVVGGLRRDRDQTVEKGDLNAGVREHIFAVTRRWMDPNNDGDPSDGIDGWRLDVAGEVGPEFWRDWRALVKSINPQAITIAEIWSDATEWFEQGAFDTQMHYPFAYPVLDWLGNRTASRQPFASDKLSATLLEAFRDAPQINLIHQNLFASHDTDRFVSMLFNPGRMYDRDNSVQNGDDRPRDNNPDYVPYKPTKPDDHAYALSTLGLAIKATYLGAPMVYYGDEYGMWGADDPTCRKPTPWPDAGKPQNPDDAPVAGLRDVYRSWLRLRTTGPAATILRLGDVRHIATDNADVFAFERSLNAQRVLVVVNRGAAPFDADALPLHEVGGLKGGGAVAPLSARAWVIP